ncbi:phage tail sheath family protein [Acidicapsa acidisoli]|uniref:phage tail sheath family protein n=1 Tax=Acidicapsa acidisoli TaxID=1615681 RepID=UPI0021E080F1|nr:phage tail sheath subtilisin-like domain-containing protein [Acidicapsa acidisoli]
MPVSTSYPGVYIEEIPSGVRTITGVATSITAFLGRALSGPLNGATTINNFGDFEQLFGGLAVDYPMSYAVNDFYQNGGGQAIIVRIFGGDPSKATAQLTVSGLKLNASSPGTWANGQAVGATVMNGLTASVDANLITADVASRYGLQVGDLFNLTVIEMSNGQVAMQERYLNVTVKPDTGLSAAARARRVDRVLAQSSELVVVPMKSPGVPDLPATNPAPPPAAPAAPAGPAAGPAPVAPAAPAAPAGPAPAAPAAPPAPVLALGGSDGAALQDTDYIPTNGQASKTGLYALEGADLFNLLCIPPDVPGGDTSLNVYSAALDYCYQKRRAMLIVDSPSIWSENPIGAADRAMNGLAALNLTGDRARNAALYFPRVIESDILSQGQQNTYVPCGMIAGIMASTDAQRGVWKAPAGLDAGLSGIVGLDVNLTNDENGQLNPLGINCLRTFKEAGSVVWGARTLRGADQLEDDYKYVPVRRFTLFLEESLYRGTQWVVFEPNAAPLWSAIRLNVGAFMQNLFVQGAFQGQTPTDAYFVKCDDSTTTQNDINLGVVNIIVGFAPLKPAEFVVLQIQQIAGTIAT